MSIKSSVSSNITDKAVRRHPAQQQHASLFPSSSHQASPRCGWRCCTAGCPSEDPMIRFRYIPLLVYRHYNHYKHYKMFNITITENVLTKCQDLVVQHSSSESPSSRGQRSSQSPPPGLLLQYFCCVQLVIISISSSSNQEDLQVNYPFFIDI